VTVISAPLRGFLPVRAYLFRHRHGSEHWHDFYHFRTVVATVSSAQGHCDRRVRVSDAGTHAVTRTRRALPVRDATRRTVRRPAYCTPPGVLYASRHTDRARHSVMPAAQGPGGPAGGPGPGLLPPAQRLFFLEISNDSSLCRTAAIIFFIIIGAT
jgi:hypothetical protein